MNIDPAMIIGGVTVVAAGYAIVIGNLAFYRNQVRELRAVVKERIAFELKETLHKKPVMETAVEVVDKRWEEMIANEPSLHNFLSARDKMDIVVMADRLMEPR